MYYWNVLTLTLLIKNNQQDSLRQQRNRIRQRSLQTMFNNRPLVSPSFLCRSAVLLVLLFGSSLTVSAISASGPYGKDVITFDSSDEYHQYLASMTTPLVSVMFDDSNTLEVEQAWRPLFKNLSAMLSPLGIRITSLPKSSPVTSRMQKAADLQLPSIWFFDGVSRYVTDRSKDVSKLPLQYVGSVDEYRLMQWILKSVSVTFLDRITNDAELYDYFDKYPGFPELPRILLFTAQSCVCPMFRVLGQMFQFDAVTGVVVDTFKSPETAAIAKRYNVTSEDELPAIVVLHKENTFPERDSVHRLHVTAASGIRELATAINTVIPDSMVNILTKVRDSNDRSLYSLLEKRRQYIIEEVGRKQAELAAIMEEVTSTVHVKPPVVVRTTGELRKQCIQSQKGVTCLLVIAAEETVTASVDTLHKAAKRITRSVPPEQTSSFHYVVVPAELATDIISHFEMEDSKESLPAVLLFQSLPHRVYYQMPNSFTEEHLVTFVMSRTLRGSAALDGKRFIPRIVPGLVGEDLESADLVDL